MDRRHRSELTFLQRKNVCMQKKMHLIHLKLFLSAERILVRHTFSLRLVVRLCMLSHFWETDPPDYQGKKITSPFIRVAMSTTLQI